LRTYIAIQKIVKVSQGFSQGGTMIKEFIRRKAIKFCAYIFKKCLNKHDIDGSLKWFGIAILLSTEKERKEFLHDD
jgi:hypothetical protein